MSSTSSERLILASEIRSILALIFVVCLPGQAQCVGSGGVYIL